jgi:hypothetical protein
MEPAPRHPLGVYVPPGRRAVGQVREPATKRMKSEAINSKPQSQKAHAVALPPSMVDKQESLIWKNEHIQTEKQDIDDAQQHDDEVTRLSILNQIQPTMPPQPPIQPHNQSQKMLISQSAKPKVFQVYVPPAKRVLVEKEKRERELKLKQKVDEGGRQKDEIPMQETSTKHMIINIVNNNEPARVRGGTGSSVLDSIINARRKLASTQPVRIRPPDDLSRVTYINEISSRELVKDTEFSTVIDDDRLAAACVVLTGLPLDLSEAAKERESNVYTQHGGVLRWMGGGILLVVFMNESCAQRALNAHNRAGLFQPRTLLTSPYFNKDFLSGTTCRIPLLWLWLDECLLPVAAARALHAQMKPDRDSRVATRLIGAALGIRLPGTQHSSSTSHGSGGLVPVMSSVEGPVTIEHTVNDAWDDD